MSKDIKKALEHCVEWNCDNCPNRDELGSGETVCRGRLLPEVLEYVADLEAKLAESEADKKALISDYESRITKHQELMSWLEHNNEELKQQLADKDKEIEKITRIVAYRDDMDRSTTINGVKFTNEQIITLQNIDYFADKHNQDKISFAVDILEELADCSNYINSKLGFESGSYVSEKSIRDKIKYLKGNKYE